MKFLKLLISSIFIFCFQVNSIPMLVWKGENSINKKDILIIGDGHFDGYSNPIYVKCCKLDADVYAPKMVEFVNALAWKKKTDFIFENKMDQKFDLRFKAKCDFTETNSYRGSLFTLMHLAKKCPKIGKLNFNNADIRFHISLMISRNLFFIYNYNPSYIAHEDILINVSLLDYLKNLKEVKNQLAKEFKTFELSTGGQDFLNSLMNDFDAKIKEFEDHPFVKLFINYFPEGKDKISIFLRILNLMLCQQQSKSLNIKTDNLIKKYLKEKKTTIESLLTEIDKLNLDFTEFNNNYRNFESIILADLGFIKSMLQSLKNNRNPIIFCGARHATRLIDFLSNENYKTKFVVGDIDKEIKSDSDFETSKFFIPIKVLENIFLDHINGVDSSSFVKMLPYFKMINFVILINNLKVVMTKESRKLDFDKLLKYITRVTNSRISSSLLRDVAPLFPELDLKIKLRLEMLKIPALKVFIEETLPSLGLDIETLLSNINQRDKKTGLTLLMYVASLDYNDDLERVLGLNIVKKLLALKANPFMKVPNNAYTRTKFSDFIGCDCFEIAKKKGNLRILNELNKLKSTETELHLTEDSSSSLSLKDVKDLCFIF